MVLVVGDDDLAPTAAAACDRVAATCRLARDGEEASLLLASTIFAAMIIIGSDDESIWDLVDEARRRCAGLPILIVVAENQWEHVALAFRAGVSVLPAPALARELTSDVSLFVGRSLSHLDGDAHLVRSVAQRHHLSARQRDILLMTLRGVPRPELAVKLGVAENTIKTHVRRLLSKCDAASLEELRRRIHAAPMA